MLKYMVYDFEFPDGAIRYYTANFIEESMVTQVNEYGYTLALI